MLSVTQSKPNPITTTTTTHPETTQKTNRQKKKNTQKTAKKHISNHCLSGEVLFKTFSTLVRTVKGFQGVHLLLSLRNFKFAICLLLREEVLLDKKKSFKLTMFSSPGDYNY